MLFMVSTYGEGGPSDDCLEFNKALEAKSRGKHTFFEDIENDYLNYSIFGLGSSKYEYFNQMAKKFDQIFNKNQMKRISEIGLGDDSKNISEDFQKWRTQFWKDSQKYFEINYELTKLKAKEKNLKLLYQSEKEVEITLTCSQTAMKIGDNQNIFQIDINDYEYNLKRFLQASQCKVESIKEIRNETINGSTLKVTYSLENTDLTYQVGDNIGIYPTNNETYVNQIIQRLNFNPEERVHIKKLKEGSLNRKLNLIDTYTIRECLTNTTDLSCQVNKDILEKLSKYCFDEDQYQSLMAIIQKESKLEDFLSKNLNIVDFLNTYDSINMTFLEFYSIIPKITPRFYTVASSPNKDKNRLDIIISLVQWKGINDQKRYGITSNYYKSITENFTKKEYTTKIFVRESNFRLPKCPSNLTMICTGTGIAPFISFFQEFECSINNSAGECHSKHHSVLLFGSKNKNFDFIYEKEISDYQSQGVVHQVLTAFSRDSDKKFYVQDLLKLHSDSLIENLTKENSLIYICGGVSMGSQVIETLSKHISPEFVKKMENENRLIKELWG
jgi:sulfite reductase alpha subunit-like flavoprotein